jgi:hypothetical protein
LVGEGLQADSPDTLGPCSGQPLSRLWAGATPRLWVGGRHTTSARDACLVSNRCCCSAAAVSATAAACRHYFASLALADTKVIAALISIPPPHAFSAVLPALLAATVAGVVVMTVLACVLYGWRGLQQYRADRGVGDAGSKQQLKRVAVASGVLNVLQFGLAVWVMFMLALSMLWFGGGMVASKATTDAVATMSVVDATLPRLIKTAMGIDPAKDVSGCVCCVPAAVLRAPTTTPA